MHSTFSKIFPWFFGTVVVLIISWFIFVAYTMINAVSIINEKGLSGFTEQVWCGKKVECELPKK
jgi:ABC-type phosphate transport system permease subunit